MAEDDYDKRSESGPPTHERLDDIPLSDDMRTRNAEDYVEEEAVDESDKGPRPSASSSGSAPMRSHTPSLTRYSVSGSFGDNALFSSSASNRKEARLTPRKGKAQQISSSPIRSRVNSKGDNVRVEASDIGTFRLDSIQESHSSAGEPWLLFGSKSSPASTGIPSASSPSKNAPSRNGKARELSHDSVHRRKGSDDEESMAGSLRPPSFAESQFATIIRRQRKRRIVSPTSNIQPLGVSSALDIEALHQYPPTVAASASASKSATARIHAEGDASAADGSPWADVKSGGITTLASDREDPMMAIHRAWEFAGWGSISLLELPPQHRLGISDDGVAQLGQWKAAAIAGNAVTGSVFYALPAVVAVASVLSPISILIACLLLYPFRPIICELASALSSSNAGNYSYLSNTSSKTIAVLAAAITLLDAIATGAVSAGTASAYIMGEARNGGAHIDYKVIFVLLLIGLALFCLAGLRESSTLALAMFTLHVATMFMLIIAGIVAWIQMGNSTLKDNWSRGIDSVTASGTGKRIGRVIFDGICVAFVGLTGIECSPSYIRQVKTGQFPKALRNLHLIIILTEAPLMLLVLAVLPLDQVLSGANILSVLGNAVGRGRWLKLFVVVDACLVLCGGIITGVVAFCGLVDALCRDQVLPAFLLRTVPKTGAGYVTIALFLALTLVVSATCGFNLTTLSSVFSVSFLSVMTLFGISLLLLKYARPSLPRRPTSTLAVVFAGIGIGIIAMAGNLALTPVIIAQTLVYFVALASLLLLFAHRVDIARVCVWLVEHHRQTTNWRFTAGLEKRLIHWIRQERRAPVIYFAKTDDISVLVNALYYILKNEPTSNCKLVHCYKSIDEIPEQLDETFQLVDEIFPTVTVDLVFVEAPFTPQVVHAITSQLEINKSRAFISCPSGRGSYIGTTHRLSEYGSVRIILP